MQNPRAGSSLASGTVESEERRGSGIAGIGKLIDDDVNPQVESAWGFWCCGRRRMCIKYFNKKPINNV